MITIQVNDQSIQIQKQTSLADLLAQEKFPEMGAAVAINHIFVPRSQHAQTFLNEGDVVHIVSPMQGG